MTRTGKTPEGIDSVNGPRWYQTGFWIGWLAGAVAMLVALFGSGHAHASTPDDTYLDALSRHGITGDPAALIGAGHDVCWALDQNWLVVGEALWKPQAEYGALGIVGHQYVQARHDAVNALCPDNATWRN